MGKILSASQIRELDQFTIEHEPITSIDLMERASVAFVDRLLSIIQYGANVMICCGTGNNGGDGLVVAKYLKFAGFPVKIFVIGNEESGTADFKTNLIKAKEANLKVIYIKSASDLGLLAPERCEVLIDAILGSGLSRPLEGLLAEVVRVLNQMEAAKVAVDIATGLFADSHTPTEAIVFRPHFTITFQLPKLAFFLPQCHDFVGEVFVEDIGLSHDYIAMATTPFSYFDEVEAAKILKSRPKYAHKGNFGHVLLLVGSEGKMGAGILAARACLRSGVGLLTVCCPAYGLPIIQAAVPEAMVLANPKKGHLSRLPDITSYDVVAIGPGIGQHTETAKLMDDLLKQANSPIVVDADGLNLIASNAELISRLPKESILTPHPKEFERIAGKTSNHFERLERQQALAKKYNLNVLIKGAHSAVCDAIGNISFNTSGNAGMATAGSGDVLTGVVAGLLAQGYIPAEALKLAIFLHGLAGDLAIRQTGLESLIASDIVENLGGAFQNLKR